MWTTVSFLEKYMIRMLRIRIYCINYSSLGGEERRGGKPEYEYEAINYFFGLLVTI